MEADGASSKRKELKLDAEALAILVGERDSAFGPGGALLSVHFVVAGVKDVEEFVFGHGVSGLRFARTRTVTSSQDLETLSRRVHQVETGPKGAQRKARR